MYDRIHNILNQLSSEIVYIVSEPPRQGNITGIPKGLHISLYMLAKAYYPKGLYAHQAKSIDASLQGKHVAINTSTASGKSLCFMLPVLNELLKDPQARSLFIYPIKALSNDQIRKLQPWAGALRLGDAVQKFDGDVKGKQRLNAIKKGRLIICTPDILNMTLLRMNKEDPYKEFFRNLKYIVLDECHIYHGAFGSHMAMVIRRLRQVCRNHGSSPQFILSSATIGSPEKHIKNLTGLSDVTIINEEENGSPAAEKKYYMVKPPEDNKLTTYIVKLTRELINTGHRFLVFCNTRKEVESFTIAFKQTFPKDKDKIMPYRAGYEPGDRAAIESALAKGNLSGVFCTSALEMGIDLSQLDVCVMTGLPGNKISMLQRAGRVGRKAPGAVIICANNTPYDNYFFNHPQELFNRPLEELVINLENKQIQIAHYACARAEAFNFEQPHLDEDIFGASFIKIANHVSLYDYPEDILYETEPHFKVLIRCVDDPTYDIILGRHGDDSLIGQITYSQILREAYHGAIYLHLGKRYRTKKISYAKRQVFMDARCPMAQTKPKHEVFVKPRVSSRAKKSKVWLGIKVWETSLSITERVTGYTEIVTKQRKEYHYEQPMMRYFVTSGAVISFQDQKYLTHGAILGLATALENAYPIIYSCAKEDISSYAWSKENKEAHIYLFDSTAGGLGISQEAVRLFENLLKVAADIVINCPNCADDYENKDYGCIKCVLSNSWFNYPANTRKETIAFLNEILEIIENTQPETTDSDNNERFEDISLNHKSDNCFGRTMIANGSLVYTGRHQEGLVLESKPFNNGLIEDRLYKIQVGDYVYQFLGSKLTLIQGKVERWCLNCGEELIDFEEMTCPVCGVKLI